MNLDGWPLYFLHAKNLYTLQLLPGSPSLAPSTKELKWILGGDETGIPAKGYSGRVGIRGWVIRFAQMPASPIAAIGHESMPDRPGEVRSRHTPAVAGFVLPEVPE